MTLLKNISNDVAANYGQIDNLSYAYNAQNQVTKITDNTTAEYLNKGFKYANSGQSIDYEYDDNGTVKLNGDDLALLKEHRETELLGFWNATDSADRIQRFIYLLAKDRTGLERRLSAARDPIVATVLGACGSAVGPPHNRQIGPFPERCAAVIRLAKLLEEGENSDALYHQTVADIIEPDERRLALFWALQLGIDLDGLSRDVADWISGYDVDDASAWMAMLVAPSVEAITPGEAPPLDPAEPAFCDLSTYREAATGSLLRTLSHADAKSFLTAWRAAEILDRPRAGGILLRHAVARERFDTAEALIAEGISIGVTEPSPRGFDDMFSHRVRETALSAAIEAGSVAAVHFCLAHGADIRLAILETGTTAECDLIDAPTSAVVTAARFGQVELLKLFLNLGGDPTSPMANGITPITAAAYSGNIPCIAALVEAGANPCQGPAPHMFVDAPMALTPLLFACDRQNDEAILYLLKQGADPNVQRRDGEWALQLVMEKCRRDTIEALMTFGADPLAINRDGIDVLHSATLRRRADIVPIILEAGVDPSRCVESETGMSPLMTAAAQGEAAIVAMLLNAGADPFARSVDGETAVDLARRAADPDSANDRFDETIALLVAAMRKGAEAVAY